MKLQHKLNNDFDDMIAEIGIELNKGNPPLKDYEYLKKMMSKLETNRTIYEKGFTLEGEYEGYYIIEKDGISIVIFENQLEKIDEIYDVIKTRGVK